MGYFAFDRVGRSAELSVCSEVRVIRGNQQVLAAAKLLASLATRCDQDGAAADLPYFLSKPGVMKRSPVLLLFVRRGAEPGEALTAADVCAAVLLYEYQISGIPTGMYSSNDRSGRSTLIAPAHRRAEFASAAGRHLLKSGAHVILISFRCDPPVPQDDPEVVDDGPRALWALRQREIPDFMPLKADFDETLSSIGQRTRRNMRYYRRRAETELGCQFVPNVEITTEELLAFNRSSMYAVSDTVAAWRHRALRDLEAPLLMGLKDREGQWLSIVGARRVGRHSEVLWQMNRQGLPVYSLSLVMRSYLIEHEISHGMTRFCLEGGSGHPIRHSFVSGTVTDLAVLRRSIPAFMTRKLAHRLVEEENELACILFDPDVPWRASGRGFASYLRRDTTYMDADRDLGQARLP